MVSLLELPDDVLHGLAVSLGDTATARLVCKPLTALMDARTEHIEFETKCSLRRVVDRRTLAHECWRGDPSFVPSAWRLLRRCPNIASLTIGATELYSMSRSAQLRRLVTLRDMRLDVDAFYSAVESTVSPAMQEIAPDVTHLQLDLTCVDGEAMSTAYLHDIAKLVEHMHALTHLDVGFAGRGPRRDAAVVASLRPSLSHLGMSKLTEHSLAAMAPSLVRLTQLTSLRLHSVRGRIRIIDNDIDEVRVKAADTLASALSALTGLTHLDLTGNELGLIGVQALASSLPALTGLTSLVLDNIGIDEREDDDDAGDSATVLAPTLVQLTGLRSLDLQHNYMGESDLMALTSALRALSALTSLDLGFNALPFMTDPHETTRQYMAWAWSQRMRAAGPHVARLVRFSSHDTRISMYDDTAAPACG